MTQTNSKNIEKNLLNMKFLIKKVMKYDRYDIIQT